MAEAPRRVQLSRRKGWRMPENTVKVSRPSRWGNPFVVSSDAGALAHYADWRANHDLWRGWPVPDAATAVEAFRHHAILSLQGSPDRYRELRGKNLACWCKLHEPCHADVLLEIANA